MRSLGFITFITTALSAVSCMTQAEMMPPMYDSARHYVAGQVLDADGNGIEQIKVTIDWGGQGMDPEIKYTSSDGSFTTEIPEKVKSDTFEFGIKIEDIDGEENGGLFNSISDKVLYNMNPESPTGFLIYRLNRATASESSPQS